MKTFKAAGMRRRAESAAVAAVFDWPLCHAAEASVDRWLAEAVSRCPWLEVLAKRLGDEAGCHLGDFVDHLELAPGAMEEVRAGGWVKEKLPPPAVPAGVVVHRHPKAMLPRVAVARARKGGEVRVVAIRVESVADFARMHDLTAPLEGAPLGPLRRVVAAVEGGVTVVAVERLGYRGLVVPRVAAGRAAEVLRVRDLWRTRRRDLEDTDAAVADAFVRQREAVRRVGRDAAAELFLAEERVVWEWRNGAARVQKRRQDGLGVGWANHDHHTFRCSRRHFADLVRFLVGFGFVKRERYYAGAEAGWGAQILEHPGSGCVVFADVDLMPEETEVDFSVKRLPPAPVLRTVGLWTALHGDSFLAAGMHHLEARFDFDRLRDQLAQRGVGMMRPFSDFDFLKQAFTEAERWPVGPARVEALVADGKITREQADVFLRDGALGSHLENLERRGGFKGFNQKSVSVIIAATDPRSRAGAGATDGHR